MFDEKDVRSVGEARFIHLLKSVLADVYMPIIDEKIRTEVDNVVRAIVFREMRDEVQSEIRASVSRAVRESIAVNVKVVDTRLPPGI